MDSYSAVQVTCGLVVLCLVLVITGGERNNYAGGQNDGEKSWLCGGKGCLHSLAAEVPESPSPPSPGFVARRWRYGTPLPPCPLHQGGKEADGLSQRAVLCARSVGTAGSFCQCPAKWEGDRCEQLSLDYFLMYSAEFQKAMIIGGVVIAIIIIIVIISIYCSFRKGKKKRKAAKRAKEIEDGKEEIEPMNANGDSAV